MKKVFLGKTGIQVSEIGFGVLPMGSSQMDLPLEEGSELILNAMKLGIDFFDTAQYYDTYKYMRPAFSSADQSDPCMNAPVISSKCLSSEYDDMKEAINQAKAELDRDMIDIFLLHEVQSPEDFIQRSGAWQCLKDQRKSGTIRAIGISTHHDDVCDYIADIEDCDIVFPLINKNGLGIRHKDRPGTREAMEKAILKCHQAGKGVYAMKVFGGGNLTGEYIECLDYVSSLPGIDAIIIGFTKPEEIKRAVEYADGTIDRNYRPDTSEKIMFISQDDCIGCLSCKNRCPNNAVYINESGLCTIDRSSCLTCGYCAPVCPVRALIMIDRR